MGTAVRLRSFALYALAGALVCPGALRAQGVIATDRPDFVESSGTVGKGVLQVEGSFALDHTETLGRRVDRWTTPFLFRVGVASNLELRLESDWFTRTRVRQPVWSSATSGTTHGVSDLAVGVKWALGSWDEGAGAAIATLVHVDLPTGSDDVRGFGARPSWRIVAEWALSDAWALGVMPGVRWDRDDSGRFPSGIFGVVVGKGLTERLRAFGEFAYEQIAAESHGGLVGFVDFGVTLLVTDRWQLDTAMAVGVTDHAPDLGLTLGLSARLPR